VTLKLKAMLNIQIRVGLGKNFPDLTVSGKSDSFYDLIFHTVGF
jgi:hypothetical protein